MKTNKELKINKKTNYWYKREITSCVLCGREKEYRWRVYEKPESHEKTDWKEDACCTHFI